MNTPKMITIQGAKRSADGKWLLLTDQDNITYLSNKCWDLEMMVGATVMAQTNMLSGQDGPTWFLNSYQMTDGQPTPPASIPAPPPIQTPVQMPQQPPVQAPQAPAPAQPQVDRDASIVAQALCKTVTFSNVDQAFTAWVNFYKMYLAFRDHGRYPDVNQLLADVRAEANETVQQQGFSDEIPF